MRNKNNYLSAILFLVIGLAACQTADSTPQATAIIEPTVALEPTDVPATLTPTATLPPEVQEEATSASHLETMLAYIPASWADLHLPVSFGPAVHFVDVQQLREDMGIEPVTGASSNEEKRQLIIQLGLNIQGIAYAPPTIQPGASSAFGEWGWDIADVRQLLYVPDLAVAIFRGDFGRPEIQSRLQEKGYTSAALQDFTFFTATGEILAFAKTTDTLITGEANDVQDIVQFMARGGPGLESHPAVRAVLEHLDGVWGAILAPSPDLVSFSAGVGQLMGEELRQTLEERYPASEPVLEWDFMAIGFQGAETSNLTIIYHYLSADEASAAVPLVERFLTETPLFTSPGTTWGSLMMLQKIGSEDSAVVATAETEVRGLIGNAFEGRDYFAFLPVEP